MGALVVENAVLTSGARISLVLHDGVIAAVGDGARIARLDAEVLDAGGRIVSPAFAEPHIHLDKGLLGGSAGSLAEAISQTAARKASFTRADILDRADRIARSALRSGTTLMRAHTEVDPTIGLLGVEAIDELRTRLAGVLSIELAILPQEGIFARPGTLPLLRAALTLPATVVGGCPYVEGSLDDARRHVDLVLDLAVEHGRPADLHLDFADDDLDPRFGLIEHLADAVIARGLHGRVAIGHATSLASLGKDDLARRAARLAAAGIAVVVLPATDLFLMGRRDERNVRRGVAPIAALRAAGVRVVLSSNNVRNAFTPTGNADPLDIALLTARITHAATGADFAAILDMTTTEARSVITGRTTTGLAVGDPADIVIFDSVAPSTVIHDQPGRWAVISSGRVVVREERTTTWTL